MCRHRCTSIFDACRDCDDKRLAEMAAAHEFDLICATNPELNPTHKPATDAEWQAYREATTLPSRTGAA